MLRDRGSKYTDSFDVVFEAEDMDVQLGVPQAPRMNAHGSDGQRYGTSASPQDLRTRVVHEVVNEHRYTA